eukprot:TRINITY_DN31165_c0_g2_i1.p1 TRINITY_DN31165_c0_g2~~TRINITY_DN31165_c0_g2_i1.p1  ORF type:complete len:271 (+),score=75.86 TRINITY_DN31165_c0_g2_i1:330-1142(+)
MDRTEGEKARLAEAVNNEDVSPRQILRMQPQFWLLTGLCVTLYCAILPFNNIASAFFVETFFKDLPLADAQQRAGNAMSVLFLVSAVGTPIFGGLVDVMGLRTHFLLASAVLSVCTFATISSTAPVFSMLCLGTVYTVFAGALWPAFALAVPQQQLGTAYGVAVALQNLGLAIVPLLVGHIQARAGPGNFSGVMHVFLGFSMASVGISFLIKHNNRLCRGVLDLPSTAAEERQKQQQEEVAPLCKPPAAPASKARKPDTSAMEDETPQYL